MSRWLTLAILLAACKGRPPQPGSTTGAGAGSGSVLTNNLPSATVVMGDPLVAQQLKRGFHQIEFGQWRWTERKFQLVLRVLPKDKAHPQLAIRLSVPKPIIDQLTTVTLSCSVDGSSLGSETFNAPGDYWYRRNITQPTSDVAQVDCELDKAIPPGKTDTRELGIIVWNVAMTSGS
jgi:hypothetical protein